MPTGEERVDLCNAHAGEQRYRLQREAFRHKPMLKGYKLPAELPWPPPPSPPPAPARNPFYCGEDTDEEDEEDGYDSDLPWAPRRDGLSGGDDSHMAYNLPRPKQPMQPVERSNILPDPASNDKLLEIGTICLPIKVILIYIRKCTLPHHVHACACNLWPPENYHVSPSA